MLTTPDRLPRPTSAPIDLPCELKSRLERFFGASLNWIEIYTDCDLHHLEARACASGNRIFFASGEYEPDTPWGMARIAHEVAHLMQQDLICRQGRKYELATKDFGKLEQCARLAAQAFSRGDKHGPLAGIGATFKPANIHNPASKASAIVQCDGTQVVANMKAKTAAIWNNFLSSGDLPSWQEILRGSSSDPRYKETLKKIYSDFYNDFNLPDNRPHSQQQTLTFDQNATVITKVCCRQYAFLETEHRIVDIQNNIFRSAMRQADYSKIYHSLNYEILNYCFFHFVFPPNNTDKRDFIRIAVNIPPGNMPDALDNWLLGCQATNPDIASFKVAAPGIYQKPDTALLYILEPENSTQRGYLRALLDRITAWADSNSSNALRNWTHPLMNKLADGIAIADDPPRIRRYRGLSFTSLRAVIATQIISTLIKLGYERTTGDMAAELLMGQIGKYGINPTDPSKNGKFPEQAMLDEIESTAKTVGAIVK